MKYLDLDELYSSPAPPLGAAVKPYFGLDPEYVNLNSGSYGSTPLPVQQSAQILTSKIESNPDLFHRITYQPLLISSREQVAKLIGAHTDEVVFVTNTSAGINIILRNFEWEEGDVIIFSNTTYYSVDKTAISIHDSKLYPTLSVFPINFPTTPSSIISSFRSHIQSIPKVKGKKIVAIIDTIVCNPGALLPWKEMVEICKEEGVYSLLDAAHSIGQEVGIDLGSAAPDFWVSNCHKWLHSKRSVAVLYVPFRNQHLIKTSIPTAHTYISPKDRTDANFVIQFEWNGTIDFTPPVTIPDALKFRQWLGGEEKINEYCHDLALRGGQRLAEMWGTRVMDPNGEFTLNMVNVQLPFPSSIPYTPQIDITFKRLLLEKYKVYSAHFYHNGAWWTRVSVQVFNEMEDFEKLAKTWSIVCREVEIMVRKKGAEGLTSVDGLDKVETEKND